MLIALDVEPLISHATDTEALLHAPDLYLLGLAHRSCLDEARRRLEAGEVTLPHDLPELHVDEGASDPLPALHLPPDRERCAFCNGPDPTAEHVFPQWLSRELLSISTLVDLKAERGPRPLRTVNITAPICRKCNNRWLSVLENDVKPLLTPLVRGDECCLEQTEQKLLATWALKTAMMLDLASGSPVIPTGFFHSLRQRRDPLESKFVWIAAYIGSTHAIWAEHRPLHVGIGDDESANGFVTTFTVFRVVFQVVGHFTIGGMTLNDDRIYRDALSQIWPIRSQTIDWPPRRLAFDDDWLPTLANSFR